VGKNEKRTMIESNFLELIGRYSDDKAFNTQCWKEINQNYNQKSRYYHNLVHIEKMLMELEDVKEKVEKLDAIRFSIYYHDIIYKSTRSDNEYKSAEYFKERVAKTNFSYVEDCFKQIEATKTHKKSDDNDTNILLDLDLSILGSNNEEYQEYCKNVRKEYSIYPDLIYRKGRGKVLLKILKANPIYKTVHFVEKYEGRAKENIINELNELGVKI